MLTSQATNHDRPPTPNAAKRTSTDEAAPRLDRSPWRQLIALAKGTLSWLFAYAGVMLLFHVIRLLTSP